MDRALPYVRWFFCTNIRENRNIFRRINVNFNFVEWLFLSGTFYQFIHQLTTHQMIISFYRVWACVRVGICMHYIVTMYVIYLKYTSFYLHPHTYTHVPCHVWYKLFILCEYKYIQYIYCERVRVFNTDNWTASLACLLQLL